MCRLIVYNIVIIPAIIIAPGGLPVVYVCYDTNHPIIATCYLLFYLSCVIPLWIYGMVKIYLESKNDRVNEELEKINLYAKNKTSTETLYLQYISKYEDKNLMEIYTKLSYNPKIGTT